QVANGPIVRHKRWQGIAPEFLHGRLSFAARRGLFLEHEQPAAHASCWARSENPETAFFRKLHVRSRCRARDHCTQSNHRVNIAAAARRGRRPIASPRMSLISTNSTFRSLMTQPPSLL